MDCKDIQAQFSEYYDGDAQASNVHAHLTTCDSCASEYKKYSQLIDQVRALPSPEMPQGFHEKLMSYIFSRKSTLTPIRPVSQSTSRSKLKGFRIASYATLVASIILAFVMAGGFFDQRTTYEAVTPIMHRSLVPDDVEFEGEITFAPAIEDLPIGRISPGEIPIAPAWEEISGEMLEIDHEWHFHEVYILENDYYQNIEIFAADSYGASIGMDLPLESVFLIDEYIQPEPARHSLPFIIIILGAIIAVSIVTIIITTAKLNKR